MAAATASPRPDSLRRYPPLVAVAAALAMAVFALPSALNLPQANPAQTLEYAPVPGQSSNSSQGNFAGLGLGSGSSPGLAALPSPPAGQGTSPLAKQCVG